MNVKYQGIMLRQLPLAEVLGQRCRFKALHDGNVRWRSGKTMSIRYHVGTTMNYEILGDKNRVFYVREEDVVIERPVYADVQSAWESTNPESKTPSTDFLLGWDAGYECKPTTEF